MLNVHLCKEKLFFSKEKSQILFSKQTKKYFLVRFRIKLGINNLKNLVQVSIINFEK